MKVFIVAGEASGDLHAARLMHALRERHPQIQFRGIGGPAMAAQGLESLVDIRELSVVGFAEIARNYRRLKAVLDSTCKELQKWQPDVFVPVDYPGFNMRVSRAAKSYGIPVAWYIAPQLWAWGRHRAKKFSACVDELLVVFPFELEFFTNVGIATTFVGHPLLDDPAIGQETPPLEGREHRIAFLPGSRPQEIRKHMPLYTAIAQELQIQFPLIKCSIARSSHIPTSLYEECAGNAGVFEYSDSARDLMKHSSVGVVKTGTSTLEAALCGLPFCMVYKTSTISYLIGRSLVTLPYIALVNILRERAVVREFVQHEATVANVVAEVRRLLVEHAASAAMVKDFVQLRRDLGQAGASGRAADRVIALAQSHHHKDS